MPEFKPSFENYEVEENRRLGQPEIRSESESQNAPAVTTNEHGGIFVFGEPLGVNMVKFGEKKIFVEIDRSDSQEVLERIKKVLASDERNGKTWDDLAGIVVTPQILRHLFNLGIVTKEQVLQAKQIDGQQKIVTEISAYPFYEVFGGDTEPLVTPDHDFFSKKLITMTPDEMKKTYGKTFSIATIGHDEQML